MQHRDLRMTFCASHCATVNRDIRYAPSTRACSRRRARDAQLIDNARATPRTIQAIRREARSKDIDTGPTRTREGDAAAKAKGGASRLACAALEAALPRSAIALVVAWASSDENSSECHALPQVCGQHHVLSVPIGETLASRVKEVPGCTWPCCPISLALDFTVVHIEDIGNGRATVSVTAIVANTLMLDGTGTDLAVEVSCIDDVMGDVYWCGQTKSRFPKLTVGASPRVILLEASIARAGVFDLGALLAIKAVMLPVDPSSTSDGTRIPPKICDALSGGLTFIFKNQFLLTVEDSSSRYFPVGCSLRAAPPRCRGGTGTHVAGLNKKADLCCS